MKTIIGDYEDAILVCLYRMDCDSNILALLKSFMPQFSALKDLAIIVRKNLDSDPALKVKSF